MGRLHCETGPAVSYSDEFSVYAWHGIPIPHQWIDNKPSAEEALDVRNDEQRRAACEILGWDTILGDLSPTIIDKDDDPQIGELLEVELPQDGMTRFLRVCLLYTSPSPRDKRQSRMPSSA